MNPIERAGYLAHAKTNGFRQRIDKARSIVAEALTTEQTFLASSWGKDSVVMLHITQCLCPAIPIVHVGDAYEDRISNFTEVANTYMQRFPVAEYHHIAVDIAGASVTRAINLHDIVERYPMRLLGLRMDEGGKRRFSLKKYGAIYQYNGGGWRACPLLDVTWRDIWAYTCLHELPYLDYYDKSGSGHKRHSRTSSVLSERLFTDSRAHGGVEMGRISTLFQNSPGFYNMLAQISPELAGNI